MVQTPETWFRAGGQLGAIADHVDGQVFSFGPQRHLIRVQWAFGVLALPTGINADGTREVGQVDDLSPRGAAAHRANVSARVDRKTRADNRAARTGIGLAHRARILKVLSLPQRHSCGSSPKSLASDAIAEANVLRRMSSRVSRRGVLRSSNQIERGNSRVRYSRTSSIGSRRLSPQNPHEPPGCWMPRLVHSSFHTALR